MLKAPVRLEDLMDEWSKDAPMDSTEIGKELARIPNLHAKYASIMSTHNVISGSLRLEYNRKKAFRTAYYRGELNNPEDLEKYNLEPVRKVMKDNLPLALDADDELNKILAKKMVNDEIVEFCRGVLKELNNRTWQLRTMEDWEKWINGR